MITLRKCPKSSLGKDLYYQPISSREIGYVPVATIVISITGVLVINVTIRKIRQRTYFLNDN